MRKEIMDILNDNTIKTEARKIVSLKDSEQIDLFVNDFVLNQTDNYLKSANKKQFLYKHLKNSSNLTSLDLSRLLKDLTILIEELVAFEIMDREVEVAQTSLEYFKSLNDMDEIPATPARFKSFSDNILSGGWRPGTKYCVIADSNTGKTAFVLNEMIHLAHEYGKKIAIFETDMDDRRTFNYMKSLYLSSGYNPDEQVMLAFFAAHFIMIPTTDKNGRPIAVEELVNYLPQGLDFLVLDLVNNMYSVESKDEYTLLQNLAILISSISKAKELSVIAIAVKNKTDGPPKLNNVKGNVNFAFSFDTVFDILDRNPDNRINGKKSLEFVSLKNRDGMNGSKAYAKLGTKTGFEEDFIDFESSSSEFYETAKEESKARRVLK